MRSPITNEFCKSYAGLSMLVNNPVAGLRVGAFRVECYQLKLH
jgi:hypothetical protein